MYLNLDLLCYLHNRCFKTRQSRWMLVVLVVEVIMKEVELLWVYENVHTQKCKRCVGGDPPSSVLLKGTFVKHWNKYVTSDSVETANQTCETKSLSERQRALRSLRIQQGKERRCHIPAIITKGLFGSALLSSGGFYLNCFILTVCCCAIYGVCPADIVRWPVW